MLDYILMFFLVLSVCLLLRFGKDPGLARTNFFVEKNVDESKLIISIIKYAKGSFSPSDFSFVFLLGEYSSIQHLNNSDLPPVT